MMSIEHITFFVGFAIGICLSAVLMVLERLKTELDDDIYRLNITKDIQELKAEVEELKNDNKISLR